VGAALKQLYHPQPHDAVSEVLVSPALVVCCVTLCCAVSGSVFRSGCDAAK
jgi:hypothetical protein